MDAPTVTSANAPSLRVVTGTVLQQSNTAPLRILASEFESVFIAEMLKHAGLGIRQPGVDAGSGVAAFNDMLTEEYASAIARAGGFGLAEMVYASFRKVSAHEPHD